MFICVYLRLIPVALVTVALQALIIPAMLARPFLWHKQASEVSKARVREMTIVPSNLNSKSLRFWKDFAKVIFHLALAVKAALT